MYRRPIAIIAISLFFIQMLPLQNTAHLHAAPPPGQTSDLPNLDTDLCFNLLYQALNRGSLTIPSTVFLNWDAQEKLNFISERYKLPKKDANEFYSSALRALYGNHPNELCKALTMCLNGSEHSNPIQHALIVKYSGYSDESLNLALSAYKEAMKRSDALGYVYLMRMAQILRDYPDLHNALGVGSIRLELKALRASDSLNCVQVQRMIKEYLPFSFGQIMLPTLRDYYFVCYDAEYDSNDTNKFLKSLQPVKSRLLALKQSTDDPTNDLLMQRALLDLNQAYFLG